MSDGISDANAVGDIGTRLENATHDLRKAIDRAKAGHRGLTVDILQIVNEAILSSGYKLVEAEKYTGYR